MLLSFGSMKEKKMSEEELWVKIENACEEGEAGVVLKLLSESLFLLDVSLDWYGCTPLHIASGHGRLEVVRLLLSFKANINSKDRYNRTPLHYACARGHLNVIKLLLLSNANIDEKDEEGKKAGEFFWFYNPQTQQTIKQLITVERNLRKSSTIVPSSFSSLISFSSLQREYEELERAFKKKEEETIHLQRKLDEVESQNSEGKEKISLLINALLTCERKLDKVESLYSQAKERISLLTYALKTCERKLDEVESQNSEAEEKISLLTNALKTCEMEKEVVLWKYKQQQKQQHHFRYPPSSTQRIAAGKAQREVACLQRRRRQQQQPVLPKKGGYAFATGSGASSSSSKQQLQQPQQPQQPQQRGRGMRGQGGPQPQRQQQQSFSCDTFSKQESSNMNSLNPLIRERNFENPTPTTTTQGMAERKIVLPKISLPKDQRCDMEILYSIFHSILFQRALGTTTTQEYIVCRDWLGLRYVSSPDLELQDLLEIQLIGAYASLDRESHQNQALEIVFYKSRMVSGMLFGNSEKRFDLERWVVPIHFFSNWTKTPERVDALRDQLREIFFTIIEEADSRRDSVPFFGKHEKSPLVTQFEITKSQEKAGFFSNFVELF